MPSLLTTGDARCYDIKAYLAITACLNQNFKN